MKAILLKLLHWSTQFGFNPLVFFSSLRGAAFVVSDYVKFRIKYDGTAPLSFSMPCLSDRFSESGSINTHYFHQDLYVSQRVFELAPEKHVDIGSRVDGFVSQVASYRNVEVFDIRPLTTEIRNIKFLQADIMEENFSVKEYCDSLSCLHALEHFGLGRYSDPIRVDGHIRGLKNLAEILKVGGTLYLSVPIGKDRVEFNAHRIFSIDTILKLAKPYFQFKRFSYIDDRCNFFENIDLDKDVLARENNFGCRFGCGIFEFTKLG